MSDLDILVCLRKSFGLIAKGLMEKETYLEKNPERYPYSSCLRHGINMFLAVSYEAGETGTEIFQYADEAAFLKHYICLPIKEWFADWKTGAPEKLKLEEQDFYHYEAFAWRRELNYYHYSDVCSDFLETQDTNIVEGTDERVLYESLIKLSQEDYCFLRQYIIEHPVITISERRDLLCRYSDNDFAKDAVHHAYEKFEEKAYRCPVCGWTMITTKYGPMCHSEHCSESVPFLQNNMEFDGTVQDIYRLRRGIVRYISFPGKLELQITDFCKKYGLEFLLWPQMDRYDVEIHFHDGDIWEIDAKSYRNPWSLRTKIERDNGFPEGDYQKGFVVVPDEFTKENAKYTVIAGHALENQKNVKCVNFRRLKSEIRTKIKKEEEHDARKENG